MISSFLVGQEEPQICLVLDICNSKMSVLKVFRTTGTAFAEDLELAVHDLQPKRFLSAELRINVLRICTTKVLV